MSIFLRNNLQNRLWQVISRHWTNGSRESANAVSKDLQTCFCIIPNYFKNLIYINYVSSSKTRHVKSRSNYTSCSRQNCHRWTRSDKFIKNQENSLFLKMINKLIIYMLLKYFSNNRGHPFSTYAKFSEKLIFLTPWYADVCVRIRG